MDGARRQRHISCRLLEGEALAVWLELSEEQQDSYTLQRKKEVSTALMPMEFVSLDEFHRRKMQPAETLSVFVHDLKKLFEQAMPGLDDKPARDHLLLHQFLVGIPDAVSQQLRATGEIKSLVVVAQARLLMTIDKHGQTAAVTEGPTDVQLLREQVVLLTGQFAALSTSRRAGYDQQHFQNGLRCFSYNRWRHIQRSVLTVTEVLILVTASSVVNLDISPKSAIRETTWGCLCRAAGTPVLSRPTRSQHGNSGSHKIESGCHHRNVGRCSSRINAGFWVVHLASAT